MSFITLNKTNISQEHICCAFSDKKCTASYEAKKEWLSSQFENGFEFKRIDQRAKVFIETVPSEFAWVPIFAPNYLYIGCFWVSGKYKNQGLGKQLLKEAIQKCKVEKKDGLVTVVGKKKFHFMSDTKWLLKQGFEIIEETKEGFILIALKIDKKAVTPSFEKSVYENNIEQTKGCVVYYSNRCPYSEYHVLESLKYSCEKRDIPLKVFKIDTLEKAKKALTPATIFSLYFNGNFVTTDISVCMDSRFDKIVKL